MLIMIPNIIWMIAMLIVLINMQGRNKKCIKLNIEIIPSVIFGKTHNVITCVNYLL